MTTGHSPGTTINREQFFKPTRVAIFYNNRGFQEDFTGSLRALFSPLRIPVLSNKDFDARLDDYDVIGILGEPMGLGKKEVSREESECTRIAFVPSGQLEEAKLSLKTADSVVLCDARSRFPVAGADVVFHFFESLIVPSLLNIDLSDVRNIAKGIGLSFYAEGEDSDKIISGLPKACFVARSALLHFSCNDDVTLREVYSISKAISLKQDVDQNLTAEKDQIRKINIKMGLRVNDSEDSRLGETPGSRIRMTAILFGIR